jgi:hypothetical protein
MIDLHSIPLAITLPLSFFSGLILGHIYFRALRETASLIVSNGNIVFGLLMTLGRMTLLGVCFFYLAKLGGGLAILAALAGVLCAKHWLLRQEREGISQ